MPQNFFSANNIKHVDYKDVELLTRFLRSHSRISSRKSSGISAENQRKLALAVKRARFMGLLPYVSH